MNKLRLMVRDPQSNKQNELDTRFYCVECKRRNMCHNAKSCYMMMNDIVPQLEEIFAEKFDDAVSYGYDTPSRTYTFYAEIGQNPVQKQSAMNVINTALRRYKQTHGSRQW